MRGAFDITQISRLVQDTSYRVVGVEGKLPRGESVQLHSHVDGGRLEECRGDHRGGEKS